MIQVVETRENTFKFYENERDSIDDSSPYLEVKIIVTEKEYENKKRFYYVDYDYKIITKSDLCEAKSFNIFKNTFPFKNDDCNSNGEVIYKNDLTSKIVDYLLMDDDELEKYTNNNTAQTYRSELMKALVSLWD
jgi:hypothetical protein